MEKLSDSLLLILKTCTDLPSPPAIAAKIIELSSCETSGLSDVADVVSIDPALSAKLLRMANSPLYTKQRKVENLRQAITLFGMNGTLNIALSFSLKQGSVDVSDSGLNYNLYWKRSLASAMLCQNIIQRLGNTSKDCAFLAGLLQDIGMLALDKAKPDLYRNAGFKQSDHNALCNLEIDALNSDHSMVGAWLLEQWHLPGNLLEPIQNSLTYPKQLPVRAYLQIYSLQMKMTFIRSYQQPLIRRKLLLILVIRNFMTFWNPPLKTILTWHKCLI